MRNFAFVYLLVGVTSARAEVGAMVGVRTVSLVGDTDNDSRVAFAVAGVFMHELARGFAIGSEPGVRSSGSSEYRLRDFVLPMVGRYTYEFSSTGRIRAILAVSGSVRFDERERGSTDDGDIWSPVEEIRQWDLDVVAGIGIEGVVAQTRFFVDLRHARGLVTVDARDSPLAIYRRELGVWIGVSR